MKPRWILPFWWKYFNFCKSFDTTGGCSSLLGVLIPAESPSGEEGERSLGTVPSGP